MAELYLAKQSGLEGFEKVVVIKQILSHLAQDNEFVEMFLDEARIAAKLSHPNIVQIYDLGKADDSFYIAMEYVSGRNIQHLITKEGEQKRMIPVEHACRIVAGVCDGLYYAHTRKDYDGTPLNIVHRDISPQNILISFAGGVKLVDFGIAKASTQLAQTRAGVLKGKYAYMSPEQVRGSKIDQRSDVFSVGLVMYEMLTGHRAFERENSLKTLKAIVQEKPLNPKELNPLIPDPVVKLLSKALEKNPDRRYASAQDMQLAIEDYLETSAKKSNNVRLSRYMYELFDDELHAEGGTMIVQGIGEVIIPTGQKGSVAKKPVVEEEVDHKTLSAALLPNAEQRTGKGASTKGDPAPAGARLVRDDARAEKPAVPPPQVPDAPDAEDISGDDKTIPVYDLEDFERKKAEHAAKKAAGKQAAAQVDDDDEDFDENQSSTIVPGDMHASESVTDEIDEQAIDDARRAARGARPLSEGSLSEKDESTRTVSPGEAPHILDRIGAASSTNDLEDSDPPNTNPGAAEPEWEGGTAEFQGGTQIQEPPEPGGERSFEAVGPGGVLPKGQPAVRPAAGIRPAAPMGGAVAGARVVEERRAPAIVAPPPSRAPADSTPVTSAAIVSPKKAPPATKSGGMPTWAIAAIAAAGLFLIAALVLVGVIVWRLTDEGGGSGKPQWVQLEVRSEAGAVLFVDGEKKPAMVLLVPAGKRVLKVELEGKEPIEREVEIAPPGPVVENFSFGDAAKPSAPDDEAGKPAPAKGEKSDKKKAEKSGG